MVFEVAVAAFAVAAFAVAALDAKRVSHQEGLEALGAEA
jgi:hypothetical protein